MQTRRAQKPITIRSDKVAAKLAVLTRDGRSQAQVIEEALELMPIPTAESERAAKLAELDALIELLANRDPPIPSMAEFNAREYDDHGNPR